MQLHPHAVPATSDPRRARVTVTGRATLSPTRWPDDQRDEGEQRLVRRSSTWPVVVDQREVLAVGVDHRAEVGAGGPHEAATCSAWVGRSKPRAPLVDAYGLTPRMSAPSLASTFGITNEVEP